MIKESVILTYLYMFLGFGSMVLAGAVSGYFLVIAAVMFVCSFMCEDGKTF